MAKTMRVIGLEGFPSVKRGDSVVQLTIDALRNNHVTLDDGDVVVIAHKIVSKAEGRTIRLRDIRPSTKAKTLAKATLKDPRLVELVLLDTRKIMKKSQEILIVESKQGHVCINAGVDKSNVQGHDGYALLPENPDESANYIRSEIMKHVKKNVAVIVTDTYSRPFRRGQVEFAIGISGIEPFKDYRGQEDLFGNLLKVKNTAVVDEIACAAELVMGQGKEGVPVVIVKNAEGVRFREKVSAKDLNMSKDEDLFKGTL